MARVEKRNAKFHRKVANVNEPLHIELMEDGEKVMMSLGRYKIECTQILKQIFQPNKSIASHLRLPKSSLTLTWWYLVVEYDIKSWKYSGNSLPDVGEIASLGWYKKGYVLIFVVILVSSQTMEQHTLKIVTNCLNTNIYSYLETSGGQSSNPYLNVVHFLKHQS